MRLLGSGKLGSASLKASVLTCAGSQTTKDTPEHPMWCCLLWVGLSLRWGFVANCGQAQAVSSSMIHSGRKVAGEAVASLQGHNSALKFHLGSAFSLSIVKTLGWSGEHGLGSQDTLKSLFPEFKPGTLLGSLPSISRFSLSLDGCMSLFLFLSLCFFASSSSLHLPSSNITARALAPNNGNSAAPSSPQLHKSGFLGRMQAFSRHFWTGNQSGLCARAVASAVVLGDGARTSTLFWKQFYAGNPLGTTCQRQWLEKAHRSAKVRTPGPRMCCNLASVRLSLITNCNQVARHPSSGARSRKSWPKLVAELHPGPI